MFRAASDPAVPERLVVSQIAIALLKVFEVHSTVSAEIAERIRDVQRKEWGLEDAFYVLQKLQGAANKQRIFSQIFDDEVKAVLKEVNKGDTTKTMEGLNLQIQRRPPKPKKSSHNR